MKASFHDLDMSETLMCRPLLSDYVPQKKKKKKATDQVMSPKNIRAKPPPFCHRP